MYNYTEQRLWSDKHLFAVFGIIKQLPIHILGLELKIAKPEEDMKQATDFKVIEAGDKCFACRLRKPGYANMYPWDISIRHRTQFNKKTEVHKILEGWGDLFFYGHVGNNDEICRWHIIDLDAFRKCWKKTENGWSCPNSFDLEIKPNGDGTEGLYIHLLSWPNDLVKGSSHFRDYVNAHEKKRIFRQMNFDYYQDPRIKKWENK